MVRQLVDVGAGKSVLDEPQYLTTREVASLLRVKERKVYELTAAEAIPYRRVTGKLLFPQKEIVAWLNGDATATPTAPPPPVVAGSHDPLLDWALRESGCGLGTLCDGSLDGLDRFARGEAVCAGLHLAEDEGWNAATVAARQPRDAVLITFAMRTQGLLYDRARTGTLGGVADLAGLTVALRQEGSGARTLFDRLVGGTVESLNASGIARTETEAAAAVRSGDADAALGLAAVARQFGLDFTPLASERFDLLIDRRAYFEAPMQTLMAFLRSAAFARKAEAMGDYDIAQLGTVRWVSP